jgi:hypothetical protein
MCGYQGYEFGASYPDSLCIKGRLYDADSCDEKGRVTDTGEDIPCPMCRPEDAIKYHTHRADSDEHSYAKRRAYARKLVADIRRNRRNGTEPWKMTPHVSVE